MPSRIRGGSGGRNRTKRSDPLCTIRGHQLLGAVQSSVMSNHSTLRRDVTPGGPYFWVPAYCPPSTITTAREGL